MLACRVPSLALKLNFPLNQEDTVHQAISALMVWLLQTFWYIFTLWHIEGNNSLLNYSHFDRTVLDFAEYCFRQPGKLRNIWIWQLAWQIGIVRQLQKLNSCLFLLLLPGNLMDRSRGKRMNKWNLAFCRERNSWERDEQALSVNSMLQSVEVASFPF